MTMRVAVVAGATACLAVALSACGGDAPQQANVVRADSAGVRIITSTGPDTALTWRFDTLGVLTDSLGEPWLFTSVSPAMVLTDRAGRTYVLEREPAIRRFGRDGTYERSIGRKGGAPGEMELPFYLLQQGDSIGVVDFGRQAMVRWGSDLEAIADLPLRDGLDRTQGIAFRSGGLWQETFTFDSTGTTTILRGDTTANAAVLARLFEPTPTNRGMLEACGGRMRLMRSTYFSPTLHWDAQGPRILVSTGPRYELSLYEGNRLIASVRRDLPTRTPGIEDLRRMYPEGMKISGGGMNCTIPLEEILEGASLAETMPFVFDLTLLSDATMWVRRSLANEKPPVLDVFGSDGAYVGTVRGFYLPVGLLPNGELLVPMDDEESGGLVIARMRVTR